MSAATKRTNANGDTDMTTQPSISPVPSTAAPNTLAAGGSPRAQPVTNASTTAAAGADATTTTALARAAAPTERNQVLLKKLSANLLKTYNSINQKYYERKKRLREERKKKSELTADNYDYVVNSSEKLGGRYVVDMLIGKGSFGRVVKAYDEVRQEFVAVKIVKSKRAFYKQAQIEIMLLKSLAAGDPRDEYNLIRLRDTFVHNSHQCLVFDLLSFNLYELLRDTKFTGVSLNLIRKFARQLLKSLDYLSKHQDGVIHCDLKPENILLRDSKHSLIRVIDFGSACFLKEKMYTYIQSRFYRAPEVLLGYPYDCAIDMWSLGCILVEMHTGKPLFNGSSEAEQVVQHTMTLGTPPSFMIEKGKKAKDHFVWDQQTSSWRLRRSHNVPPRLIGRIIGVKTGGPNGIRRDEKHGHTLADYKRFEHMILRMLDYNPATRIKPADALNHKFFITSVDSGAMTDPVAAGTPTSARRSSATAAGLRLPPSTSTTGAPATSAASSSSASSSSTTVPSLPTTTSLPAGAAGAPPVSTAGAQ